jgi:hypothetical protein
MIDSGLALIALRNRVRAAVSATTGSTTLSATTSGYVRSSGSFVTDGFKAGMEVLGAGFTNSANNDYGVVSSVAALALGITGGRSTESAGAAKTVSAGLPFGKAWEGDEFTPTTGRPYIEESFVPASSRVWTFPANGGHVRETGLYVIRWYGVSRGGAEAIRAAVDAVKVQLSPGTGLTLSDGSTVRVRADTGPYTGELRRIEGGWSVLTLTVPWMSEATNAVAA